MKNSTHRQTIKRVSLDRWFSTVRQSIMCSTSARPMIPPTAGLALASGRSCLVNKEPICNSKEIRQSRNWMGMWKHFEHEKYSQSYLAVIYHRNLSLTNTKFSRSVVLWPIACSSLSVSLDDQKSGWATRGVWETKGERRPTWPTVDTIFLWNILGKGTKFEYYDLKTYDVRKDSNQCSPSLNYRVNDARVKNPLGYGWMHRLI